MLLYLFTTILALKSVMSRDALKSIGPPPIITNSLVNLGKMDISIHFDTKEAIPLTRTEPAPYLSPLFLRPEPIRDNEPCPCSSLKNLKQPLIGSPSDVINKIIRSNDLFSFNKDSITSSMCCDSHEDHEEIVTFEFNSKPTNGNALRNSFSPFSHLFDITSQKTHSVPSTPLKAKAVEIFLFPKKKDAVKEKNPLQRDSIEIIGDKELKSNIINVQLEPIMIPTTSTVKKDLTNKENNRSDYKENTKVTTTATFSNLNAL